MIAGLLAVLALARAGDAPRYTSPVTPFLSKPFTGEHPVSGLFDHRPPRADNDHRQLTAWGVLTWGRAGHAAYDWPMKVGTPVLAAADGEVVFAKDVGPTACGDRTAEHDNRIQIRHRIEVGGVERTFLTAYLHLSEIGVRKGDTVKAGAEIARAGSTGCSTGPHLHFAVMEVVEGLPQPRMVDPYGWDAPIPDPALRRPFAHSEWLWLPDQAPLLFRPMGTSQHPAWGDVRITRVRGFAWQDARYPNNEFVQLSVRPKGPRRVDLSGWSIRNRAGLSYTFPEGTTLHRDRPIRLYSGTGTDTELTLYWGRPSGVWDDEGDCVHLVDRRGDVVQVQDQGRREDRWCGDG